MQLTLVSHYGKKPAGFVQLIARLQGALALELAGTFVPYAVEQVHGTLIGLEGVRDRRHDRIRNENYSRFRNEERFIDFDGLLGWLRSDSWPRLSIQLGGFQAAHEYPFTSQGRHPFIRSFSLQQHIAVAMGWPRAGDGFPAALDQLRRGFQPFGVLHKWHGHDDSVDNDFFFVLGRLRADPAAGMRHRAETAMRELLAAAQMDFAVTRESLSFVAYTDPQLPPDNTQAWSVSDARVTATLLASLYDQE